MPLSFQVGINHPPHIAGTTGLEMGMQLQVPVNMSRWCGIITVIPVLGVLNRLIIARLSSPKENSREVRIYGGVPNEFETLD